MNQRLAYDTDVIREKTAEGPFLLDGEHIKYETSKAIPASVYVIAAIALVVPPLFILWSALIIGFPYYSATHSKIWITNKRVVHSVKVWPGGNFSVMSIPLSQIRVLRRTLRRAGYLLGFLDRQFGSGDIEVFLKDKMLPQALMSDVKEPGKLISAVKAISAELVEGE